MYRPLSTGGTLLHGVKSSPMCKASMLDNVNVGNKIVHQSVGGSIATALRDHRQSCVMPIQPNRSLPVHPAPHHTHCRGNNMLKTASSLVRTVGLISSTVSSAPSTETATILQGSQEELEKKCKNAEDAREDKKSPILDSKKDNKSEKNDKVVEEEENNARVDKIENGLIEGLNDLSKKRGHSDWRKKIMWNRENRMENDLIDITRSPERKIVDLCSTEPQTDEPNFFSSTSYIDQIGKHKKKRHRRRKKNSQQSTIDDLHLVQGHPSKTVPPLRLKKVQSLRELQSSICQPSNPPRINSQFRFDDTRIVFSHNTNFRDIRNLEDPGKYRIITGHTPPCDDQPIDSSNVSQTSDIVSLDAAKLKYKKSKLVLKLGQLKTKTIELGNEMLRTVLSSPNGPHTKKEL